MISRSAVFALVPFALAFAARANDVSAELLEVRERLRAGDRDAAVASLERIVRDHPASLDAHLLYQDVMREAGRLAEILPAYAERAKADPKDPEARFLHARLLDAGRAAPEFREVTRLAPGFAPGWVGLARALDATGKAAGAEEAARTAVKLDPARADAHELLGWILEHRNEVKEAEASYRRAVELDEALLPARWNLAHLLARAGRGDDALRELDEAGKRAPREPRVLVHRGLILAGLARKREAAQAYEAAAKLAPRDARTLVLLSETYAELSEWKLAQKAVEAALAIDPALPSAHASRGYALLRQGRAAEAAAAYTEALRGAKENASYVYYLALSQEKAGDLRGALANFKRACALDPQDPFYLLALGSAYEVRGKSVEAIAAYRDATKLQPKESDLWVRYGHALADAKRPREAVDAFRKAIELDPKDLETLKSLGIVYEVDLRDAKAAAACYREYIARGGADKRVAGWLEQVE